MYIFYERHVLIRVLLVYFIDKTTINNGRQFNFLFSVNLIFSLERMLVEREWF